jgi:proline racemase
MSGKRPARQEVDMRTLKTVYIVSRHVEGKVVDVIVGDMALPTPTNPVGSA